MTNERNTFLRCSATILGCAAILLLPTIINGYPLVYSDTGTYIRSAFAGYVPTDRPYWYGVFIRVTSGGGITLWGVVLAQALLCAGYVLRVSRTVLSGQHADRSAVLACAVLTAGTGIGWYVGQLIPDIFTGIGLLAVFLLVAGKDAAWRKCLDCIVIGGACWMHLSNLVILPLAGALLLFLLRRFRGGFGARAVWFGVSIVLGWGGLALANKAVDGKAYLSRSGHIFLMGRMIDVGMLRPYLEEHCATEHFGICAYMDSLPATSAAFLWFSDSPVARQGGWDATQEEYGRIVRGSLTEPRFLLWHVRGSLASTAEQLCTWEICRGLVTEWYRTPDCPPYMMIAEHMPHELPQYLGSMQNGGRGELSMRGLDMIYRFVLAASLVLTARSLTRQRAGAGGTRSFILFAIAAIIIGAWVCATLSVVDTRYFSRDAWLLPFAVILSLAHHRGSPIAAGHQDRRVVTGR